MVDVTGECAHVILSSLGNPFIACLNRLLQFYPLRLCSVESVCFLFAVCCSAARDRLVQTLHNAALHLIAGPPIGDTHGPSNVPKIHGS